MDETGVFPAQAGMIPRSCPRHAPSTCVPRENGDEPRYSIVGPDNLMHILRVIGTSPVDRYDLTLTGQVKPDWNRISGRNDEKVS